MPTLFKGKTVDMDIQWFPGHMKKAIRVIEKNLPLVDIVIEIVDARIPMSSANPDLHNILKNKQRMKLVNKSDLADHNVTQKWISYFKNIGITAIAVDCKAGKGLKNLPKEMKIVLKDKIERDIKKGMIGKPIRAMVVGIPNVGKSIFINKMANKSKAKVENRPGVTRGKQWIDVGEGLEFLDMPGILWPKFDDQLVGEKLAYIGSINDNILDIEILAVRLLNFLYRDYSNLLINRYKLDKINISIDNEWHLLKLIGKKRGMIIPGGDVDIHRAAIMVLNEFREGKIGKISLELPNINKKT